MFPVLLCAVKLSGSGADSLFLGVLRHAELASCSQGSKTFSSRAGCSSSSNVVRFWTTDKGMILCADRNTVDSFGLVASGLVGQPFSSLCTDTQEVNRQVLPASLRFVKGMNQQGEKAVMCIVSVAPPIGASTGCTYILSALLLASKGEL